MKRKTSLLIGLIGFSWLLCSCTSAVPAAVIPKQVAFQAVLTPFVFHSSVAQKGADQRLIYLIDRDQHVVPWAVNFPKTDTPVEQTVNALVKDDVLSNSVPNGFSLPLPPETSVNHVEYGANGEVTVDLTSTFLDYPKEQETAVFEALTQSLLQLEEVKRVKLKIDGKPLQETKDFHAFIGEGLDKNNGTNLAKGPAVDMTNTVNQTVFLLSSQQNQPYFLPVTLSRKTGEGTPRDVIRLLMMNDWSEQDIYSPFNEGSKLTSSPVIHDNQLSLSFNSRTLTDLRGQRLSPELLTCLALTFIDEKNIHSVMIHIKGIDKEWEIHRENSYEFIYTVTSGDASAKQQEVAG